MNCSPPGSSVHGISQATMPGVGCHFLFQRMFQIQGSNPCLLHGQVDFFTTESPGKPNEQILSCKYLLRCIPWVCVTWTWMRHSCSFGVLCLTKGSMSDPFLLSYWGKSFRLHHQTSGKRFRFPHKKTVSEFPCRWVQEPKRHCWEGSERRKESMSAWGHLRINSA